MSIAVRYFFFFNDTATTEIYTLSLHDALPISLNGEGPLTPNFSFSHPPTPRQWRQAKIDRKSTRLNSSHSQISYAVFCLKKKKKIIIIVIQSRILSLLKFLPI